MPEIIRALPARIPIAEVRWDCRELREQLRASSDSKSLEEVVRKIVTVRKVKAETNTDHFFEVQLDGVVRLWNDSLLNPENVSSYLAQVAPLPLSNLLPFREQIEAHVRAYSSRQFPIFVNKATTPLCRPHVNEFLVSGNKSDRFVECQLLQFSGMDGDIAAVGWILHHNYLGAIKASPEIRGLRARVAGIQIGGEDIFVEAFPESRFNSWVVGELHVVDPRIVPNGRRDDFEHNASYTTLLNQLIPIGRDIARRCRSSSATRSRVKSFELAEKHVRRVLGDIHRGHLYGRSLRALLRDADGLIRRMRALVGTSLLSDRVTEDLQRRLQRVSMARERLGTVAANRKQISPVVPASKRRFYDKMARLIIECAPSKKVATAILARVAQRLAVPTIKAT